MARVIRPGEIIYAGDYRPASNLLSSATVTPTNVQQAPQGQQGLQSSSSVLANRNLDVSKFEKALQERHQMMQIPSVSPTEFTYEDKGHYVGTLVNGKR